MAVATRAGRHLIAGDAVPLYENVHPQPVGCIPPGIHVDVATCFQASERM